MPKLFSKSIFVGAAAGFVTFSIYGFVVHGMLLQDIYMTMPAEFWRPEGGELMQWLFLAYALMAWVMAVLRPASVDTPVEGFQRGLLVGVLVGSVNLINHAFEPFAMDLTLTLFLADVAMFALAGAVIAAVAGKVSD